MNEESLKTEEDLDAVDEAKMTFLEKAYLSIIMTFCIGMASSGFYWIISVDDELPTGPAIMVVGSLMSGITIIKFAAERKRSLDPQRLIKAVTGLETMVGIGIAIMGLAWHLIGNIL